MIFSVKITEMLDTILNGSKYLGTFSLVDLLQYATTRSSTGIAVAKDASRQQYLAFLAGEPEGAIFIDENGTLYGDKAVMLMGGNEPFVLCDVPADIIGSLVMGCRIFEKTHIKKRTTGLIPEFGMKKVGIGILSLTIRRGNVPQNGLRISIRNDGQIVGSDVTTIDGSVSFRVMYGNYTCIVQDRSQTVTNFQIVFDEAHTKIILDL
jgi:hypothetical protein